MIARSRTAAATLAALLLVFAAPVAVAESAVDPVKAQLDRVADLYRALAGYHVLMQGDGVTPDMVNSVLFDVERYVDEIDSQYATGQLFIKDRKTLDQLKSYVAKAHFECALLHARGVDLEGSITQYERVVDLLGFDPAEWTETVARSAKPGLLPGAAETVFVMSTPREAVEDLKIFWSAGVVTRFIVKDYAPSQRSGLKLERIGGATDAFSETAFSLAATRFGERLVAGLDEFRIVLPPGRYHVASSGEGIPSVDFLLMANGIPDPVVLDPNTFSFNFTAPSAKCRPAMTLNGLPVRQFQNIPFGTYRLEIPRGCAERMPDKITVTQNAEASLRTEPERLDAARKGEPIFLFLTTPPNSTYNLRM